MRIIWKSFEMQLPLGRRIVGLRLGKDRPSRIVLTPEEWAELGKLEHLGEDYKKKLQKALAPGGTLE